MLKNNEIIQAMYQKGFKINEDPGIDCNFYRNLGNENFGIHEDIKLNEKVLHYSSYMYNKNTLEKLHDIILYFEFNNIEELKKVIEIRFA